MSHTHTLPLSIDHSSQSVNRLLFAGKIGPWDTTLEANRQEHERRTRLYIDQEDNVRLWLRSADAPESVQRAFRAVMSRARLGERVQCQ